ncbi:catechol 2,3-dioxygenase-like lactoylglutathione lyase family enzyme [Actinoplanes campanulatus]|uniref:Catechol 2,3-dioxygenase-like lactoylglutathione lyase family enzyme n=1 Tax=Actinoplanes campanulatus TaxID=113559 RepID=A0A7W5FF50_9ACTN|nr:VOC family protein [Actinoplanes campanulatus]MBB3096233.1 catechol 2,3-dioxygenase-like lactoylglutathione lyase family enzyme [Actinoplanes campanulatus]GGN51157.1 glyoxalase [Actinoplanes campanulatus]GID42546.1 glyoxalase [Actinoplanes campanulatus]
MTFPKLKAFVLDTPDARRLAEFYRELLGLEYREGDEPPAVKDWLQLRAPDGSYRLAFQETKGVRPTTWPDGEVPQQMHLDIEVGSVEELDRQHGRVLSLGGTLRSDQAGDPEEPLRVYVDPAGHTFCVFVG